MGRAMRPSLAPRMSTALALAPALRDGMRLLRLNQQDLAEDIRAELARNPFLIGDWPTPRSAAAQPVPLESVPTPAPSIFQRLCTQIELAALPCAVRMLALQLVGELREDGMLDATVVDRMLSAGANPARLQAALEALQSCDPPGVGARSLAECLELQLRDMGLDPDAARHTVAALPLLAGGDLQGAAQALGLSPAQTRVRLAMVRRLRATPMQTGPERTTTVPVEAVVTLARGRTMQIDLSTRTTPRLRLDRSMVAHARATGFGGDLLDRAEALLAALSFRHDTLRRVIAGLVEYQHRALTDGIEWLRPLTRRALAQQLELHPSTVSRAVAGKAIEAQGHVWQLAALFSNAVPQKDAGSAVAAARVRRRIARMIAEERPERPLSDAAVVEQLRTEGVDIARRTVAKYRETMRIPGSATRRAKAGSKAIRQSQEQAHSNRGQGGGNRR